MTTWPEKYYRQQAEIILNNFDLTSAEVNAIVEDWNREIESVPDGWYDNLPPDHEERHSLAVLQRIALKHIRARAHMT